MQLYLKLKNYFSNGLKRNRKICKAWQHDTQNSLNKCMSPLQHRSHSDNSFLLICIEEFKLCFVGNQQWCSSFTFSSAFLLPENPFVVLVWRCTFEIILAMEGDKSWENVTCFLPSAHQTSRLQEHRMKWKDTGSSFPAESSKMHLRSNLRPPTSHRPHNSWSQD